MSVSNPNLSVSRQDLADFYDKIFPYLGGKAAAGFTPVGTVISVMGVTAPANYLACDGTVYNISDYPELAAFFGQQFSMVNKFGGNGTTTFAVPDLRGEFLRGTGTNSHANNGDGAAVGVHQDATTHSIVNPSSDTSIIVYHKEGGNNGIDGQNSDKRVCVENNTISAVGSYTLKGVAVTGTKSNTALTGNQYTSRPTNTSVLWCIATKNIYMNPSLDYSTDEKVVGSWLDGKPIYQRTIVLDTGLSFDKGHTFKNFDILDCSDKYIIDAKGTFEYLYIGNRNTAIIGNDYYDPTKTDYTRYMSSYIQKANSSTYTADYLVVSIAQGIASAVPNPSALSLDKITVTVQYTKTT